MSDEDFRFVFQSFANAIFEEMFADGGIDGTDAEIWGTKRRYGLRCNYYLSSHESRDPNSRFSSQILVFF